MQLRHRRCPWQGVRNHPEQSLQSILVFLGGWHLFHGIIWYQHVSTAGSAAPIHLKSGDKKNTPGLSEINLVTQFRGVRMCPWPVTFVPCRSIFWRPCHLQVASCPLLYASACWALLEFSVPISPNWRISIESKANVMIPSSAWSHLNILKHIKTPKKMH